MTAQEKKPQKITNKISQRKPTKQINQNRKIDKKRKIRQKKQKR